ncbi:MAG: ester cyclase [Pseudomonadota bacterium]
MKKDFYDRLQLLANARGPGIAEALDELAHPDALWRASHPMNEVTGPASALAAIYQPLIEAMPDLERRDLVFCGGEYQGRTFIAAMGHYFGTFRAPWFGIPANGALTTVRYGEVYEIEDGRIRTATLIWDVLDVIEQVGVSPLAPGYGRNVVWAGPLTGDGLIFEDSDPDLSAASIAQTLEMHQTLFAYDNKVPDRDGLMQMEQKHHWHPKMLWFGPAGIGSTRGLSGFVDHHQLPFREAFRRPTGTPADVAAVRDAFNAHHFIRIGDGKYSVTGGWPSFVATHYGGNFCGMPATGRDITMRVMDFYHHHEGLIRENWVPIDMLDVFQQMGLDVLELVRRKTDRLTRVEGAVAA